MREGWEILPFREVLTQDVRRVPVEAGRDYPIVGVLGFGRGLLYRDPVSAEMTSYRELNAIGPDQLVYSKLKAFEGAITVAPPDLPESYASGEFPTFRATERVLPAFLRLLTQGSELWAAMAAQSKGMGGRRERLSPVDFLTVRATFPPVPEQRRIVDLIGALDLAIAAAVATLKTRVAMAECLVDSMYRQSDRVPLSTLAHVLAGYAFRSEEFSLDPGDMRLLRNQNVGLGRPDWTDSRFLPARRHLPGHRRFELQEGDVVVSLNRPVIAGGVKASILSAHDTPSFLVQRVARVRPHDLSATVALWACLRSERFKRFVDEEAKAAGHVPMLSASQLERFEVPSAVVCDDSKLALQGAAAVVEVAGDHVETLKRLRAQVVSVLLSGEHEIPEPYDELMEAAT